MQYTLSYTAGAHGSMTGPTAQTVIHGGNGAAVTAVPNAHYHFVNWSDGSTANPLTVTNVTQNMTLMAIFGDSLDPAMIKWVNFAYTGTEAGTQAQPFNTLEEAVTAVASGGLVRIKAGATPATSRLTRPLRIECNGGAVTLGRTTP